MAVSPFRNGGNPRLACHEIRPTRTGIRSPKNGWAQPDGIKFAWADPMFEAITGT